VLALGIGGFATFNAFMPEYAKAAGLSGSKWVFATYSIVCLLVRLLGARLPERLGLGIAVSGALSFLASGLVVLGAVASPTGVFAGTILVGFGMSFIYPALMAMTVNSVGDHERSSVISTFTMFFEVGSALGGLVFGALAQATGKRGGFLGGAVSALIGLVVLWRVVIPADRRRPISASEVRVDPAH
jgi:MFS family permease